MKHSESIKTIAPALLKAQKTIGAAKKDAVNPFFKSSYADLGAVMEACKEALNDNDISVLQPVGSDDSGVYVETVLLHESGEFIADRMRISVKAQNDPQAQGSAITYARRYGLQSMVFIPAEDDDGEKATNHKPVIRHTENGETPTRQVNEEVHDTGSTSAKAVHQSQQANQTYCTIHKNEMKWREREQRYDHRWKVGNDWHQCTGKPVEDIVGDDPPDFNY